MSRLSESPTDYVARMLKDDEYVDGTFLHAVAKVFNKDIIVVPSSGDDLVHIKGGRNGSSGKGTPLFLGYTDQKDFYQSIIPESQEQVAKIMNK